MNPVTKFIGDTFLRIGGRMTRGAGATEGDFLNNMLPREVEARLRPRTVIRTLSSLGHPIGYEYICQCREVAVVPLHERDTAKTCGRCGFEFSIRQLIEDVIKNARVAANQFRGANLVVSNPITAEEFTYAEATLPVRIPSLVKSGAQARMETFRDSMKSWDQAGEVSYDGDNRGGVDLDSSGFDNPRR